MGCLFVLHLDYVARSTMRLEIRMRGEAVAALDEKGNPLRATLGMVKNYGGGDLIPMPKGWAGKKVVIVDLSEAK